MCDAVPLTLEDEGTRFGRNVKTGYQVTQRHITEDLDPKLGSSLTENILRLDYGYYLIMLKEITTVRCGNPTREVLWTKCGVFIVTSFSVKKWVGGNGRVVPSYVKLILIGT